VFLRTDAFSEWMRALHAPIGRDRIEGTVRDPGSGRMQRATTFDATDNLEVKS
jgi:hypothetical protein